MGLIAEKNVILDNERLPLRLYEVRPEGQIVPSYHTFFFRDGGMGKDISWLQIQK